MAKPIITCTHLAVLNLFREADGTVEITVAGASQELMAEWHSSGSQGKPVDFIEGLIVEAAERIKARNG